LRRGRWTGGCKGRWGRSEGANGKSLSARDGILYAQPPQPADVAHKAPIPWPQALATSQSACPRSDCRNPNLPAAFETMFSFLPAFALAARSSTGVGARTCALTCCQCLRPGDRAKAAGKFGFRQAADNVLGYEERRRRSTAIGLSHDLDGLSVEEQEEVARERRRFARDVKACLDACATEETRRRLQRGAGRNDGNGLRSATSSSLKTTVPSSRGSQHLGYAQRSERIAAWCGHVLDHNFFALAPGKCRCSSVSNGAKPARQRFHRR
jgi:hypothetical protein